MYTSEELREQVDQDTLSCVSSQEDTRHTSVLITGTTKSLFSTPCISITTGQIPIKFTYLYTPYTQLYIPNLKKSA